MTLTGTSYKMQLNDIVYFNQSFDIALYTTPYYITSVNSNTITVSQTLGGPTFIPSSGLTTNLFIYSLKQVFVDNSAYPWWYTIGQTVYSGATELQYPIAFHQPLTIVNSGVSYSRYDVLYLSSDNSQIHILQGNQVSGTSPSLPNYLLSVPNTIILGYAQITYNGITGGGLPTITYTWNPITVNTSVGYVPLSTITGASGTTTAGVNYLTLTFGGTSGSINYTNYSQLRSTNLFTEITNNLLNYKGAIISGGWKTKTGYGNKYPIGNTNIFVSSPTTSTNGYITFYFDSVTQPFDYFNIVNSSFLVYYIDNEFVLDPDNAVNTLITTNYPLTYYQQTDVPNPIHGIAATWSNLYQDYYNGIINNGDYFYVDNISGSTQTKVYLKMYLDANSNLVLTFVDEYGDTYNISEWLTNYGEELVIYSDKGNLKESVEIQNPQYITDLTNTTSIYVDKIRYASLIRNMYLEAYYDVDYYDSPSGEGYLLGMVPRKLVRIINIQNDTVNPNYKILYTDGPIKITDNSPTPLVYHEYYTTSYQTIENYFTELVGVSMKPFTVSSDSTPDGTDARQQQILSVIDKSTNLAKGLANKNRISWRYLVDSFGLGLTANSKQEIVDLCGMKLNCFGFINMPSVRQLKTSVDPSFINSDKTLNTSFLLAGGDESKNPSFLYSFGQPSFDANGNLIDGRSCTGYFFPYIKGSDDPTKFVPPAAKIAKAYMNKFITTTGGIYPWTVVAGVIMGALPDVIKTEMNFNDDQLLDLMNMNANPVNYVLNRNLFYINSENTAQVFPYSSLSIIHCREVLIELENRMYDMLLNFQWRFNTQDNRNAILYRANQICKELLDANALYNFQNICDTSNNTDYVISNQMGVIDTLVELIAAMGVIVNNITILKKGTLTSTGFAANGQTSLTTSGGSTINP